jgi:predicted ATPase
MGRRMTKSKIEAKVAAPLLESFTLEGVNGYKTISVRFERNVKIISAENGAGKTTLLNALYALLTGKAQKLLQIQFSRFTLTFTGGEIIEMEKNELFPVYNVLAEKRLRPGLRNPFTRFGLRAAEVEELLQLYAAGQGIDFRNCSGFRKLMDDSPYDGEEIANLCQRELSSIPFTARFSETYMKIKKIMNGVSVLYLPTFRRIEADLPEYQKVHHTNEWDDDDDNDHATDWGADRLIFFGMKDVTDRLEEITRDIRDATSKAYSRISGRTLDQLLSVGAVKDEAKLDAGSVEMLRVVLARLDKANSETEDKMLALVESGDINQSQHQSLRSFFGQLLEVYQEKRDLELAVEEFVNVVEAYWGPTPLDPNKPLEKSFRFDRAEVRAQAIDTYTGKPLPLSTLSSGEKQIVSIFARLYLDFGKRYLILIDEPELSLSMEWQQKFLPDVFAAPSCVQLIAITHSPFTFDNELDPYAGSLAISYAPKVQQ